MKPRISRIVDSGDYASIMYSMDTPDGPTTCESVIDLEYYEDDLAGVPREEREKVLQRIAEEGASEVGESMVRVLATAQGMKS